MNAPMQQTTVTSQILLLLYRHINKSVNGIEKWLGACDDSELSYTQHRETICVKLNGSTIIITYRNTTTQKFDLHNPNSIDEIAQSIQEFVDLPF